MTTIKQALEDLLNTPGLSAEEAVDRHFAPSLRQRVNGSWADRAAFLARIGQLREVVEQASITVLDELAEADRYAERHVIDLLQRDGTRIVREVYLFAERGADGRFTRIEEMALPLDGPVDRITGPKP